MPSAKVRIGNWQEELAYENDRKQLLKDARGAGATLSQRILVKVKHHNQSTELQPAPHDGYLRFSAPLAIQNAETQGCLATDLDDKQVFGGEARYACTTMRTAQPQVRSSWLLVAVPSKDDHLIDPSSDADVVHYGQRFVIQTLDSLSCEPLYLSSAQKNYNNLSRVTNNQDAFFSPNGGQNAIWTLHHANGEYRPDMIGKPVKANSLALIVHQATNTPLASTVDARVANDFGAEYEVCCNRFLKTHSKSGSAAEQPSNLWALITAPAE